MAEKKRKCNFSAGELAFMVELVEQKRNIIMNVDTRSEINKKKSAIWSDIAAKVSSACGVTNRKGEECKTRWQQLASKVRSEIDEIKKTGGGSAQPLNELSAKVWGILKNPATDGLIGFDTCGPSQSENEENVDKEQQVEKSLTSPPIATTKSNFFIENNA
jgi:hypothetical protein